MTTLDIYHRVNEYLIQTTYPFDELEEKKALVEESLKRYTLLKMKELGLNPIKVDKSTTTLELLSLVNNMLDSTEKHEFFRHYTHYIIFAIAALQGWEVMWWESSDKGADEPYVSLTDDGKINNFYSPEGYDPFETTISAFEFYHNAIREDVYSFRKLTRN